MKLSLLNLILLFPLIVLSEPVQYADSSMIESRAFGESREIMISLPESYEKNSLLYPVIHTVRGQLDLLAVVASIDMLDLEVPEFIVVGISGTGAEFFPNETGKQTKFSQFLHGEVVPHIEKEFRTAPYSILIGHSNAGKFVMNDWLGRGKDFSDYYAISPSLEDGAINARARSMNRTDLSDKGSLLVSMGNESRRMLSMFAELRGLQTLSKNTTFLQLEDQTHMSGRIPTIMAGLRSTYNKWKPSREVESGQFEDLRAHYLNLSEQYRYEVAIPLETMMRLSAFDSASTDKERWQNAAEVVRYALARSPSDADEFVDIANQLVEYGRSEGSERLMSYVCEQAPEHIRCVED